MNAVLVKYNSTDKIVTGLLSVMANMQNVEIKDDVWLTDEEIKRIEKVKASGIRKDIDNLLNYLKSQI